MRPRSLLPVVFGLTLGCPPAADLDDPPPIPKGGDTGDTAVECSGTAPEVTSFVGYADGLHEDEQGQQLPAMLFEMQLEDVDGDLSFVYYRMWWDDVVDDAVDTSGAAFIEGQTALSSTRCDTFTAGLALALSSGGNPAYGVWHDFAVSVADEAELWSVPVVTQGAMPLEDGSDPEPYDG
jgi:hypothetical protein